MRKVLFILLPIIFLHVELEAKTSVKYMRVGETWIGYATAHLEIEYFNVSNLLLIKDSVSKLDYPLKDSIDSVSLTADIEKLRHKSNLIENSQAKDIKQFVLNVISKKEPLPCGCFYIKLDNGARVYLGKKSTQSNWFMYWDGKLYSVEQKCADLFREKYSAISVKKIQENIQSFYKEE